jgi:hypothetical protein
MTKPLPEDQLYSRIDKLPAIFRPNTKAGNDNQCWNAMGKCDRCKAYCIDRNWKKFGREYP